MLILPGDSEFDLRGRQPDDCVLASVKGLVRDRDEYLLELREWPQDDAGQFNLIGGKMLPGETYLQTFRREAREEAQAGRMPAGQLHYLTHYVSQRPEGPKQNVMVFWHNRDGRLKQGDDGKLFRFCCVRDLEDPQILPWLKPKTLMVVELAMARGFIPYRAVRKRRIKQFTATRKALAVRKTMMLKDYELS